MKCARPSPATGLTPVSYTHLVGLVVAVAADDADKALAALKDAGETGYIIGQTVAGDKGITLK